MLIGMEERPGLRERKRRQTRRTIAEVAIRLFAERGFDAVTVAEIADAADVAKVTLFNYFPTKESLVLDAVGDDDPAQIVADRAPGRSPVAALRAYYRTVAAGPGVDADQDLITRFRLITESPALTAGVHRLFDQQREALAAVLAAEPDAEADDLTPHLMAAQLCAAILTVKAGFFRRLVAGDSARDSAARLINDVDRAFDLVEHGLGDRYAR